MYNLYILFVDVIFVVGFLLLYWASKKSKKYNEKLKRDVKKQILEIREKDKLLVSQSKLAAIGESLSHIAHQWKQPLSHINSIVLNIEADFEEKKLTQNKLTEHLDEIEKMTSYMSDTINSFSSYLYPDLDMEKFSMKRAFNGAFDLIYKILEINKIKCDIKVDEDSDILGFKKQFIQALLVVLTNAKDVLMGRNIENPEISVHIHKINANAILDIYDNAGGIQEEHFNKIFDAYFTTKSYEQAAGHGLSMAKMIIEKGMNGILKAENWHKGAKFSFMLPITYT